MCSISGNGKIYTTYPNIRNMTVKSQSEHSYDYITVIRGGKSEPVYYTRQTNSPPFLHLHVAEYGWRTKKKNKTKKFEFTSIPQRPNGLYSCHKPALPLKPQIPPVLFNNLASVIPHLNLYVQCFHWLDDCHPLCQ